MPEPFCASMMIEKLSYGYTGKLTLRTEVCTLIKMDTDIIFGISLCQVVPCLCLVSHSVIVLYVLHCIWFLGCVSWTCFGINFCSYVNYSLFSSPLPSRCVITDCFLLMLIARQSNSVGILARLNHFLTEVKHFCPKVFYAVTNTYN